MSEKEQVLNLLKTIQKGLKEFTLEEFNNLINGILKTKDNHSDKKHNIEVVFNLICEEYSISRRALVYGRCVGEIQQARSIAYCVLHFNLGLPIRYIAKRVFFLKYHNSVGIVIKYHNSLNPKVPPDRIFKEKLQNIQINAVKKFKTEKI